MSYAKLTVQMSYDQDYGDFEAKAAKYLAKNSDLDRVVISSNGALGTNRHYTYYREQMEEQGLLSARTHAPCECCKDEFAVADLYDGACADCQ